MTLLSQAAQCLCLTPTCLDTEPAVALVSIPRLCYQRRQSRKPLSKPPICSRSSPMEKFPKSSGIKFLKLTSRQHQLG